MRFLQDLGLHFLYWILRLCIWLRYRVEIVGLDKIVQAKGKGILFLPNHPAEIDPIIMTGVLWRQFRPRPLVVEQFYFREEFRIIMDLVRVLAIPAMATSNKWKEKQIEKTKKLIVEKLGQGESFLIYPAGQLKRTPEEHVGGASLIYDLLNMKPDAPVVLIRTTGLWGSTFSCASSKVTPDFGKVLLDGFKTVLKNGIFFCPRRHVKVELEFAPKELPIKGQKQELNKWLDNWYNKNGPEPLKLVSLFFWKHVVPQVKIEEKKKEHQQVTISEEKKSEILGYLSKVTHRRVEDLKPELHFSNDLGLDSIDVAGLNVFLEERFNIRDLIPGQLEIVNDLFLAAEGKKEQGKGEVIEKKAEWPKEAHRKAPEMAPGETLHEVFLNSAKRMKGAIACTDAVSGALSYNRLLRGVLILSLRIREMPGENIGILLPSSVGAYVTILATLLAGKVPVMLNWTTGFRNLEYAAELCGLKTILSSYRFLSRAQNVDLGKADDLLLVLEEIRHELPLAMKLKGLFLSMLSPLAILKKIPKKPKKEDMAVIIFTSGTETLPKGVPLTHDNLLSNQRDAFETVKLLPSDILLGVLPPFHSFGFSVTGLVPLLAGIKACYAPDPTNSRSLAYDIDHWKPTIFCCTPGFIQGVLRAAKEEQLKSLRMVVSGAEKAPNELFEHLKGKLVLEGYGVSECSPIVTLDREGKPHKGVGYPIPHVELCIISEDGKLLGQGQEGEICISGPGVFNGYLGIKKDPFIHLEGKRWYRSGDRGRIDPDGYLMLTGRLKRFIKIGGEMVSLGGIEEDLLKIGAEKGWLKQSDKVQIAVTVKGNESDKPEIVLFAISDINREEANKALKELGHGSIVKIAEVRKIDEIPLTGTGKVQYRLLDEILEGV